jgi:[FeFe] hydrogenase (group B1/B3)
MKFLNDADQIKREVLIEIIKAFCQENLIETIDKIPVKMRPREMEASRCCVYKDRAVLKYRIMAALGFGIENELDETIPLSDYAEKASHRTQLSEKVISVLDIACHGCIDERYVVTTSCHGCLARPCMTNCPKNAIEVHKAQAKIDHEKCIDCGKCMQVCPFHAIIRVPIPCEEACPVDAISRTQTGKQEINFETCTSCGKCVTACPFGAVLERSHIINVLCRIQEGATVIPLVAPSIIGQFHGLLNQVAEALQKIGFGKMEEVALGAEKTTKTEAEEFFRRMKNSEQLMTSSCCPAFTETVKRHVPELAPFVSEALTPMNYTAMAVKQENPDAVTVFIGPCIAKKKEAQTDKNVDYVLTFEELAAWFDAENIDVNSLEGIDLGHEADSYARGFATSCGVSAAVLHYLIKIENKKGDATIPDLDSKFINGLDKKMIKQLKLYTNGKLPGNFLEVMSCQGGCLGGPCTIGKLKEATDALKQAINA